MMIVECHQVRSGDALTMRVTIRTCDSKNSSVETE